MLSKQKYDAEIAWLVSPSSRYICQILDADRYAESCAPWRALLAADSGRVGNHKGFVNIHNQAE